MDRAQGQSAPAKVVIPLEYRRGNLPLAPPAEPTTPASPVGIDMNKLLAPPVSPADGGPKPEAKKGP